MILPRRRPTHTERSARARDFKRDNTLNDRNKQNKQFSSALSSIKWNLRIQILLCSAQSPHASAAAANIDRDIVLTPNETIQLPGKILYFDPSDSIAPDTTSIGRSSNDYIGNGRQLNMNDDGGDGDDESSAENFDDNNSESNYVPWLEPLKHALYLVLNHKINGNSNKR